MSYAFDLNVLLYASDGGSPYHEKAKALLDDAVQGRGLFYLCWPTVMGYLRVATHPSIFDRPLLAEEALANMNLLMRLSHVRMLSEAAGFWDLYRLVTGDVPTRGNLVPDAHIAVLLRLHGVKTLITHDRDFRKFDFLTIHDPFG